MFLPAGTRLGPYEILAAIGAGGMVEVYKARDTRLGRIVAVKICAEQFSKRFGQEARAIAALNHPNICTLHDVGPNYLVMEYIDGATLTGPIPLAEALPIARQIAEAGGSARERLRAAPVMARFRCRTGYQGRQPLPSFNANHMTQSIARRRDGSIGYRRHEVETGVWFAKYEQVAAYVKSAAD
jgi:serine/threonine protein kinase